MLGAVCLPGLLPAGAHRQGRHCGISAITGGEPSGRAGAVTSAPPPGGEPSGRAGTVTSARALGGQPTNKGRHCDVSSYPSGQGRWAAVAGRSPPWAMAVLHSLSCRCPEGGGCRRQSQVSPQQTCLPWQRPVCLEVPPSLPTLGPSEAPTSEQLQPALPASTG